MSCPVSTSSIASTTGITLCQTRLCLWILTGSVVTKLGVTLCTIPDRSLFRALIEFVNMFVSIIITFRFFCLLLVISLMTTAAVTNWRPLVHSSIGPVAIARWLKCSPSCAMCMLTKNGLLKSRSERVLLELVCTLARERPCACFAHG